MVNHQLLVALNKPMTQENRLEILRLVRESKAFEDRLPKELNDPFTVKLINIAAGYIMKTCRNLFLNGDPEQKWQDIMLADGISKHLKELLFNPALIYFTQTVLILGWALMKGDDDGREGSQDGL